MPRLRFLIPALAAIAALTTGFFLLTWKYKGFEKEVFIEIPRGTPATGIARLLTDNGVIAHPYQFLLARALRPGERLQAGEYYFASPDSVWNIFNRIVRGDVFYHQISIPEGYNIFDIAALVGAQGFITAEDFLKAARNPSLIADIAPQASSLEGYLFPDTYRFPRLTTAADLVLQMTNRFRQAWKSLDSRSNVHETVTLASLVEKETGIASERPLISSVFRNRLRKNMPLQCDPTVVYAALLGDRYRGTIYRSDLDNANPYNTYRHAGLPPGPIANPGLESLRAALNPADSDYLYFVALADGSGGHQFSKGLTDHQRAVAQYRRSLRQARKAKPSGVESNPAGARNRDENRMGEVAKPARAGF